MLNKTYTPMQLISDSNMVKRYNDDKGTKIQQNVDYLEKLIALILKKLNQEAN